MLQAIKNPSAKAAFDKEWVKLKDFASMASIKSKAHARLSRRRRKNAKRFILQRSCTRSSKHTKDVLYNVATL